MAYTCTCTVHCNSFCKCYFNKFSMTQITNHTYTALALESSATLSSLAMNWRSRGTSGWPDSEMHQFKQINLVCFYNVLSINMCIMSDRAYWSSCRAHLLTCGQHWCSVSILVELQIFSDQFIDQQVLMGQRRARSGLIVQRAEHLRPDPRLQLPEDPTGLQRLF